VRLADGVVWSHFVDAVQTQVLSKTADAGIDRFDPLSG
jgi:hypothetical protein